VPAKIKKNEKMLQQGILEQDLQQPEQIPQQPLLDDFLCSSKTTIGLWLMLWSLGEGPGPKLGPTGTI